jgi:hypothetical protein
MKKLLLPVFLVIVPALTLHMCTPKVPTPADVLKEAHEAFPTQQLEVPFLIPTAPQVQHAAPKPKPRPHQVKPKPKPVTKPIAPAPRPKTEEQLPQQQGTVCIFPFNMVPQCTPGPHDDAFAG